MSGPSALGTLLVHRLDAVLGTTLASHAHLVRGPRSRAVIQPTQVARIRATPNATEPRPLVGRVADGTDRSAVPQTGAVRRARQSPQAHHARGSAGPGSRAGLLLPSASTRLSDTARLILGLLAQYPEHAPALSGRQPLWPTTTVVPQVGALAQTLAHTVAASGMFYESHLAELAGGLRRPAQLAAEPQAQLPPAATTHGDALPDPRLALLVRQQLDVLACHAFCWQGLAWPEAPLHWHLHGPERHGAHHPAVSPGSTWTTRLLLTLPALGVVQAQLALTGQTLTLHLAAPECSTLLQARAAALHQRYARHGLTLARLWVDAGPVMTELTP